MIKNFHKPLFLLAFSTALGGVAPSANAEVVPDPSTIAPDIITLTLTTEAEHSGNYIVLYDIDEGVNKYYDLTLNTTTYGTGTPSTQYTAKVPYEDVTITVNGESDEPIDNSDDYGDVTNAFFHHVTYAQYNPQSAIRNEISGKIDNILNSVFISNTHSSSVSGGAIGNQGIISSIINSVFISNIVGARGGAIHNDYLSDSSIIEYITDSIFISNEALDGGAISTNNGSMTITDSVFIGNSATGNGGAIHIGAMSGVVFNDKSVNIVAKNNNVIFIGNTENGKPNDIFNTGGIIPWSPSTIHTSIVNLNTSAEKYIYLNGGIDGDATYLDYNIININKTTDDLPTAGTVYFNGDVKNQTINMYDGTLKLGAKDDIFENVNMTVYGGLIDTLNGKAGRMNFNSFTVLGAAELSVEVDLKKAIMDYVVADTVDITAGTLNIAKFVLLSDADEETTAISFFESDDVDGLENVSYVATATYGSTTYDVTFDEEKGEFVFKKAAPTPAGPTEEETTATEANASSTGMVQALVEAVASQVLNRDVSAMIGLNSGDAERLSTWVQTFGSNDDVELKNLSGAIDTQFYGVIGGVDSKKFTYDNGVSAVYGVYGAYTRSKQKYDGNKITQNGGYFGASVAFRKDAVFNNVTLNGGYLKNEADTKFGKDKFDTKVVSVANKTGVDIQKGAWTITPSLLLSYTGIDTDDYTTKAGTKIDNDFMHVYTVAPELKVAKDFGEGFSGYAKVAYKMFFYSNEKIEADDVLMPAMSVKPYVEYGIGASKDWSKAEWNAHDIATYGEVTRHDGGRTGWDLNLGLKLDF